MIITKTIASIAVALSLLAGVNSAFALAGSGFDYRANMRAMEAAPAAVAQDESKAVAVMDRDPGRELRASLGLVGHVMGHKNMPFAKRIEKFRSLLREVVDFKPMAEFVLGRHYDSATPDEWARFYATYKELFLSGYEFSAGKNWTGEYEIEKTRAYGKDTLISIRFDRENGLEPVKVGFRVRRRPNSFFGYKIIDALTKGVSLLVTQRADFRSHLSAGGIPHLIEALEKKFGKAAQPIDIPDPAQLAGRTP